MTNAPRVEDSSGISRFLGKFGVLKDAIRELWLSFAIKCLGFAAYGLTNATLVLWLHSNLHYPDKRAVNVVFVWSVLMTVITLLVGSLTDALGFRRTLFIGTAFCIVGRLVMVWSTSHWAALVLGLAPVAIGEALSGPVLVAAARNYSNTKQRSMSFSMIYAMMNLGLLIGAWLFDWFRKQMGERGFLDQLHPHLNFLSLNVSFGLNLPGFHITTYQTLFLVSAILEAVQLPLIWLMREGAEATDKGLKIDPPKQSEVGGGSFLAAAKLMRRAGVETLGLFTTLLKQAGFYRLLSFLCLIAFIKLIYKQMDYIYPIFGVRELGDGAPFMILYGLNNALILVLAPLVGALTQRFPAYRMVIVGGLISSTSIFIMALPPAVFVPMANGFFGSFIGHRLGLQGNVNPYYVMITLFVFVLSVGEAFYSPRVYEYAAAIAPKGQEASYSALSYIPHLLAKILLLGFSGNSLVKYCPETGPRHSGTLWLIVALMSLVAPIGLIALRRVIQVHEAGRNDGAAPA